MKTKKETRGGTRKGSGAKPKYDKPTKTIAFRVPISRIEHVKCLLKTLLCAVFIQNMTVDRQHTEIFDQAHKMWAEGTSIGNGEGLEPKEQDIQHLLGGEGWVADEIDIWFDDLQKFWRWSCKISRP